jgi:galactitol-specific phosphotransferase system IIC component
MAIPTPFLRLLFAITKYLTRSLYHYWRPLLTTWISCMSAISLYQAFIPTSSHNVGVIVDPGAEIIQEVVGWVDVSFASAFSFLGFSCAIVMFLILILDRFFSSSTSHTLVSSCLSYFIHNCSTTTALSLPQLLSFLLFSLHSSSTTLY